MDFKKKIATFLKKTNKDIVCFNNLIPIEIRSFLENEYKINYEIDFDIDTEIQICGKNPANKNLDNKVDNIFLFDIFYDKNSNQRNKIMDNLKSILKPGGIILILEYNINANDKFFVRFKNSKDDLSPNLIQENYKPLKIHEITNLLERKEFEIKGKDNISLTFSQEEKIANYNGNFVLIKAQKPNKITEENNYNIPLPKKIMPREKLLSGKIEEMELSELIAVLIGMGNKHEDVLTMSKRIIKEYGSKGLAEEKNPKRIMEILALGEVNSCKLVAAFELGRRFYDDRLKQRKLIRGPEDVYEYVKDMKDLVKENFRGLYLNSKNYIIHDEVISIGHLTASLVHPREVFRAAVEYSAAGIIVIHNHPSGDPTPSENDNKVTKLLQEAGKMMQIPILDHIIVGNDTFYSYNNN